jgi:hypothetical protein
MRTEREEETGEEGWLRRKRQNRRTDQATEEMLGEDITGEVWLEGVHDWTWLKEKNKETKQTMKGNQKVHKGSMG